MEALELFRTNFHLARVNVQEDRLIYRTGLIDFSISGAQQLIKTLFLPLKVEKLFDLPGNDQIVISYLTSEEMEIIEEDKIMIQQMRLEAELENLKSKAA